MLWGALGLCLIVFWFVLRSMSKKNLSTIQVLDEIREAGHMDFPTVPYRTFHVVLNEKETKQFKDSVCHVFPVVLFYR